MNENREALLQVISRQLSDTLIEEVKKNHGGVLKFPVFLRKEFTEADIGELDLSVRSFNCLKRAGYHNVGELLQHIERREDLLQIRNLGKKSADEIMLNLFIFHYDTLNAEKQKTYMERVRILNQQADEKDGA